MAMNESEFEELSEAVLDAIERALERAADAAEFDLDFERKEGGVLELEFGDGSRMVINRHGAAREIWVAAKSGGFHFRHDAGRWLDTRTGGELFAALSRLVSAQSGTAIILVAVGAGEPRFPRTLPRAGWLAPLCLWPRPGFPARPRLAGAGREARFRGRTIRNRPILRCAR